MQICSHCGAGILEPNKPWLRRGRIVCRRCFEILSEPVAAGTIANASSASPIKTDHASPVNSVNSSLQTRAVLPKVVESQTKAINGYGLAGLIISVMGLLSAGLVSPFGLVMSLIGLKTRPRLLAVIGTIFGAIGTAQLIRWIILVALAWHQKHHGW